MSPTNVHATAAQRSKVDSRPPSSLLLRILTVTPEKNSVRLDLAFLDDPAERVDNVPGARERAPWGRIGAADREGTGQVRVSLGAGIAVSGSVGSPALVEVRSTGSRAVTCTVSQLFA